MIFVVEQFISGLKKSIKSYWTLIYHRITICLLDHIRYVENNMGLQSKGTYKEQLFCYTEIQSAEYHYSFLS